MVCILILYYHLHHYRHFAAVAGDEYESTAMIDK